MDSLPLSTALGAPVALAGRPFIDRLAEHGLAPLRATGIEVLQVNVGRLCNQTCAHCHVEAGPERREIMDLATAEACLRVLAQTGIPTLDITGGAPEMNPHFTRLVTEARRLGRHVIDRSNLTILEAPGFRDVPQFLADQQVEVVASLPCYTEQNVDRQRGDGAFARSLAALRRLNALGYGRDGTGLTLSLVYNPLGPSLPPPQEQLEADYRRELQQGYGIVFSRLFTITNMPIGRFRQRLAAEGRDAAYQRLLEDRFNPEAATRVMCRWTLSVDWTGRLYDCDFNQMLGIGLDSGLPQNIRDFDAARLARRPIQVGPHCYGCTAGAGSGCQGALAK